MFTGSSPESKAKDGLMNRAVPSVPAWDQMFSDAKGFGGCLPQATRASGNMPDLSLINFMQNSMNSMGGVNMFPGLHNMMQAQAALYYQQVMQQQFGAGRQNPAAGIGSMGLLPSSLPVSQSSAPRSPDMPCDSVPRPLKRRPFKIGSGDDEKLRKFMCRVCGERFKTRHVKDQHQLIHFDKRPYKCNICGFQAKQKAVIWRHKRKRHPHADTNVTMDCLTDQDQLATEEPELASPGTLLPLVQANREVDVVQATPLPSMAVQQPVFETKSQPEVSDLEMTLTQSATKRNPALEPILKMSQQIIENPMNEESHLMMGNMIRQTVLIQTQMNPAFPQIVVPPFNPLKPWVCYICFTGFKNKYILSQHMNTHSDARPYVCKICGFRAKQMSVIHNHKTNKHDYNAEKKRSKRGRRGDEDWYGKQPVKQEVAYTLGSLDTDIKQAYYVSTPEKMTPKLEAGTLSPVVDKRFVGSAQKAPSPTNIKESSPNINGPSPNTKEPSLIAKETSPSTKSLSLIIDETAHEETSLAAASDASTWQRILEKIDEATWDPAHPECGSCKKHCVSQHAFMQHQLKHVGLGRYHCRLCQFKGLHFAGLAKHMRTKHKKTKGQFNKFAASLFETKPHDRKKKVAGKVYRCMNCPQLFQSRQVKCCHALAHFEHKRYACGYCGKQSHKASYIIQHIRMQHPTLSVMVIDQFSGQQQAQAAQQNSSTVLDESFDPIKNPESSAQLFPNNKHPHYSEEYIATTGVPLLNDSKQNPVAQFTTQGTRQLPFRCPFCGRVFRLRHVEEQHRYIHQPFRKYECEYCGFRAKQKAVLYRHRQTKHANEPGVLKPKKGKRSQSPLPLPSNWNRKSTDVSQQQGGIYEAKPTSSLLPGMFQQLAGGLDKMPPLVPAGPFSTPAAAAALQGMNQAWIFHALSQSAGDDVPVLQHEHHSAAVFPGAIQNGRPQQDRKARSVGDATDSSEDSAEVAPAPLVVPSYSGQRSSHSTDFNGNYSAVARSDEEDEVDEVTGMLRCHVCHKLFGHRHVLQEHMISHLPKHHRPYKCDECDHTSRHKASLWRHKQKQHCHDPADLRQ